MTAISQQTLDQLVAAGTSTLTGALAKRGLRNIFMQDVSPLRLEQASMVGIAYTMRFIPVREDKSGPNSPDRGRIQLHAMENCPPGGVLVIDSRGDARAASAGDLYIGRLKARGCSGIVTDGGFRDSVGILKTGLPAYHRRPTSPPSTTVHQPIELEVPIACGGVAVFPGDVIVGDVDGIVVVPAALADEVAQEATATLLFDTFAEELVAAGRPLPGLFPVTDDKTKAEFEAWRAGRS